MPNSKTLLLDKSGVELYLPKVEGIMYPDYGNTIDGNYDVILKKVKELQMREDDIVGVGFPRSGNNWVFEILYMVLNQTTEFTTHLRREVSLEQCTIETLEQCKHKPSPRVFFSHLFMDSLPQQILTKKPRMLYIIRNFKDMAVSFYHFVTMITKFIPYKGKWQDYLDLQLQGHFVYGSWFEHIKMAEDFMKSHPDMPCHVMCYEKMKLNTVEEVQKLCQFLGKPDDLAPGIAEKVEFGNMKRETYKIKFYDWEEAYTNHQGGGFLRKGIIGDWRNHFTEEQSKMADQIFEEKLTGYSLGDMLRPFMGLH